jgi:DNA-binding GntR family transcriptional regulator
LGAHSESVRSGRGLTFSLKLRPKPVNSTREHRALVQRLQAGDAEGAARENRAHRERASRELLAIFEQYNLADKRAAGIDLVLVRENTEGLFGRQHQRASG